LKGKITLLHIHYERSRRTNVRVCLLKGDEPGRVGGTNTWATVLAGLVRNRKLSKVVSNHVRLNLNLVEGLTVVNAHNVANHLGDDEHAAKVSTNGVGLLTFRGRFLDLPKLINKGSALDVKTARKATTGTSVEEAGKFLILEIEELVKVHTTVAKLAERPRNLLLSVSHFCFLQKEEKGF